MQNITVTLIEQLQSENMCVICQCSILRKGFIQQCQHIFCFDCIMKWTERSHQCPQCRGHFSTISEMKLEKKTGLQQVYEHTVQPIIDQKKEKNQIAHLEIDNLYYEYLLQQIY